MSTCISPGLWAGPGQQGLFAGLFLNEDEAHAAIRGRSGDHRVLAYRVHLSVYDAGRPCRLQAAVTEPPLFSLARWRCRGYDPVQIGDNQAGGYWFACSPLSCNYLAEHIPVNRACLIDSLNDAIAIATRFSIEQPEPGPYAIFEVWELAG